jgi:DNA-binding transcriptional LysR family regulator
VLKNWDNLRFLLAVVRAGSPEAAARPLRVDESTVRRRLAMLERELGGPLFERVDGLWHPTRAGLALREAAERAEQAIASGEARFDPDDPSLAGTVRVGAPDGIGAMVIAPALARLQRGAPEIRIELVTHGSPADIARREVDLLVILEPPESGRHRIRKLHAVTLRIYGARDYLAAIPPIRSLADLQNHRFIGYDPGSEYAEVAVRRLASIGIPIDSAFTCSSVFAQARAMADGAGLALLPDYMIEPDMDVTAVIPDEVAIRLDLWLLVHADVAGRARVRAVAEAIASA